MGINNLEIYKFLAFTINRKSFMILGRRLTVPALYLDEITVASLWRTDKAEDGLAIIAEYLNFFNWVIIYI